MPASFAAGAKPFAGPPKELPMSEDGFALHPPTRVGSLPWRKPYQEARDRTELAHRLAAAIVVQVVE